MRAIHQVRRGEPSLHPTIARKLLQEIARPVDLQPAPEALTARELEVLLLIAQGLSNQELADQRMVSEPTVRAHVSVHVSRILGKLHLGQPHPSRALRSAGRIDRRRRGGGTGGVVTNDDVLRVKCTPNVVHQKYRGPPPQGGSHGILDLAFTLTTGSSISAMLGVGCRCLRVRKNISSRSRGGSHAAGHGSPACCVREDILCRTLSGMDRCSG